MKKILLIFLSVLVMSTFADSPVLVKSFAAQQRYARNGLVDITVTFQGESNDVALAECSFVATNSVTKAEISVEHVTRKEEDTWLWTDCTRKFTWDAAADVGAVNIDDVELTVNVEMPPIGGVQLWENGPCWAECNIGASRPEECGYYFWWGDTVGCKRVENCWDTVDGSRKGFSFSSANCPTDGKDDHLLHADGWVDSWSNPWGGKLVAAHDAAVAHLGAPWRMPTDTEFYELINRCATIWTTRNGVYGRLVTGKGTYASKSVFLPAAGYGDNSSLNDFGLYGYYWSSTHFPVISSFAWYLGFGSDNFARHDTCCYYGQPVRPVREFSGRDIAVDGAVTHLSLNCRPQFEVASVTARQRYPWNGLVDITVTLKGVADELELVDCLFAATNVATKEAISILHIARDGEDMGSDTIWTRKFVWDAVADVGVVKIEDVALTVDAKISCVQLWKDGPYWAECNVGAAKPEEYGYYFCWGDLVGYKRNSDNSGWISTKDSSLFSFSENCPTYGKNNAQLLSGGYIDLAGSLAATHDAATMYLGSVWRMPTDVEFEALISNCQSLWTIRNGVRGRLFVGKGAYSSRSVFFPAAGSTLGIDQSGFYWSSTSSDDSTCAFHFSFSSNHLARDDYSSRNFGESVRPVRRFAN